MGSYDITIDIVRTSVEPIERADGSKAALVEVDLEADGKPLGTETFVIEQQDWPQSGITEVDD